MAISVDKTKTGDASGGLDAASAADVDAGLSDSLAVTPKSLADSESYTGKEDVANKSTDVALGESDEAYPSQRAVKAYVDSSVVGLLNDRGNHDASGNTFPSAGGSGSGGAIKKGNSWYISVAGALGGVAVNVGDNVRARVDTPGQTAGNWAVLEGNIGYVPERSIDAASTKSTPVDPDTWGLIDSAAGNVLKKITWANLKAALKTYFDTLYSPLSGGTFTATGGTVTTDGAYTIHTFTTNGTFAVSAGSRDVEYLVLGGGGGGGASNGGGGGAGGYRAGTMPKVNTSKFVTVGAGGAGGIWSGTPNGSAGGSSAFGDVVSLGGAPGRGEGGALPSAGGSGGGGGGSTGTPGSTGTLGQGFDGGTGNSTNNTAGGGGGAGAVGVAGSGTSGGNGGAGIASSITGSAVTRAGGGGGGANSGATTAGTGQNGGGNGGKGASSAPGSAATANTGGGGGGGGNSSNGGQGGSGVVILRYLT
jgi:hypothetical protein